jgi:co-chaperonin GroES (HSP10)
MEKTLAEKNLQPLHDRVLVRIVRPPTTSSGAHGIKIHLPTATDERKYNEGEVLAVGPKVEQVKPGDIVTWEVFKGQAPGHFDDTRWVIKESELLAKVVP